MSDAPSSRLYSESEARKGGRSAKPDRAQPRLLPVPSGVGGWMTLPLLRESSALPEGHSQADERIPYRGAFYGHFGHGCVHMRVSFDLESGNGIRKYAEFIERAAVSGGRIWWLLSGGHGDGQSRAQLLPKSGSGQSSVKAFGEFKMLGIQIIS